MAQAEFSDTPGSGLSPSGRPRSRPGHSHLRRRAHEEARLHRGGMFTRRSRRGAERLSRSPSAPRAYQRDQLLGTLPWQTWRCGSKRAGARSDNYPPLSRLLAAHQQATTLRRAIAQRFGSQAYLLAPQGTFENPSSRLSGRRSEAPSQWPELALFDRPGSAVGASGYRVTSHSAWHETKLTAGSCAPHRNARPRREKTGQ